MLAYICIISVFVLIFSLPLYDLFLRFRWYRQDTDSRCSKCGKFMKLTPVKPLLATFDFSAGYYNCVCGIKKKVLMKRMP